MRYPPGGLRFRSRAVAVRSVAQALAVRLLPWLGCERLKQHEENVIGVEASDAQAIEETREAHVAALNSGDADAWAAAFANDGVQMPPNAPANVGRDSIQAWSEAFLGAFRAEFSLAPEEVQVAGADWAFERGTFKITLTSQGRRRAHS
jgi:uncharacterized protein (TIGR02246 family)